MNGSDSLRRSPHGEAAAILGALLVGVMLLAIQLWLLTVSLDRLLAGRGHDLWVGAFASVAIFAGGAAMRWMLARRPRLLRPGDLR